MKILMALIGAGLLAASSAQANIGDIDAEIEEIKASVVYVAQPEHVTNRILAAADSCTLPMTHLVAIPENFDAAGRVVVACVTE